MRERPPTLVAWSFNFHLTTWQYPDRKRPSASAALESPFWPSLLPERVRLKWRLQCGWSRWSLNNEGYVLGVRWKLKLHAAEAVGLSHPGVSQVCFLLSQREEN